MKKEERRRMRWVERGRWIMKKEEKEKDVRFYGFLCAEGVKMGHVTRLISQIALGMIRDRARPRPTWVT